MNKISISDSFIVSIDVLEDGAAVMTISKVDSAVGEDGFNKLEILNQLFNEHAKQMYERLTNMSLERRNENEDKLN